VDRAGRLQAIATALAANDVARAAAIAGDALAAGEDAAIVLNLVAWTREEAGDLPGARALLQRALAAAPGDPNLRIGLAAVLRKEGRPDEALGLLDALVRAWPGLSAAWLERGYALDELGRAGAAGDSFAAAARADPACAPAFGAQAQALARGGQIAAARAAAAQALRIDPHDVAAQLALAAVALAAGEPAVAAEELGRLLGQGRLGPADRVRALTLRGDALDRLGEVDAAFAAYQSANEAFRDAHAPRMAGGPAHRDFVAAIGAGLEAADPAGWAPLPPEEPPRGHAFLLGYPRSGTTLTEQVLASVPGVAALEERPTLALADRDFLLPANGMTRLGAIDAAGASRYRADYWARVAAEGGAAAALLVDMDPLKSLRLPVVARLFPDARVLLMRRDPRDVVWSCFRHAFRFSPANYALATLEGAARHYDATMRLVEQCRAQLPLHVHEVRYEALVADFDLTTRALCGAVGLPWTPQLRAFDRTARTREVTTASAGQVRQGLYDGSGQWRRYARHLDAVLPILAPWVERFGYA